MTLTICGRIPILRNPNYRSGRVGLDGGGAASLDGYISSSRGVRILSGILPGERYTAAR